MNVPYEYPTILLNRRQVSVEDILSEKESPQSTFEQDVLVFCRQWLKNQDTFYFNSSGSTGKPKKIAVKKSQIIASLQMTAQTLQLSKGLNALLCIPVVSTGGKMMIARALQLQMKLECVEPRGNPLITAVKDPDFMAIVPLQLKHILSDNSTKNSLDKIKKVIVGGAKVDDELQQKLQIVKSQVYATYGMTETVSHIALQLLNTKKKQEYFNILPGIKISKDDRDCLKIKGPVTDNIWVQTNDKVRIINSKEFEWLGRMDFVINSAGYKIHPDLVEQKLKPIFNHLGIKNAFFVDGLPHNELGEECTLFIEGQPLDPGTVKTLHNEIHENISHYEKPRSIRFINKFVTTESGKLSRRESINEFL